MFAIKPSTLSLLSSHVQFLFFLVVVICITSCNATTKSWKYSNDILSPSNWIGEKPSENCEGTIFPEKLGSVASVLHLTTKQLILPYSGELEIRQSGFLEISDKDGRCIRIKELEHRHWLDPENWNSDLNNSAVPHAERVPCNQDDVVFSHNASVAVFYPEIGVSVNSIRMQGVSLTNAQWQNFLQTDYGIEQFNTLEAFDPVEILIEPSECTSRSGCVCHRNQEILLWICDHVKADPDRSNCVDPIKPIGFCHEICGGSITLEVKDSFVLDKFKNRIPKYMNVDHYVGKVIKNGRHVVQVVFAEGSDYTESSAYAARDFHGTINGDLDGYKVLRATLEKSGIQIPKASGLRGTFSIVFGTLFGSLVLFGCVYVIYAGPLENYSFRSRLPFAGVSFGNFRQFVFSRFENRYDGMSMAASMVSLEKAFDNPMYGTRRASTSSDGGAVDVVVLCEQKSSATTSKSLLQSYDEDRDGGDESQTSLSHIKVEEDDVEDVGERS